MIRQLVEGKMYEHYDSLVDEDPEFKAKVAQSKAEGKLEGLQQMALEIVEEQYPSLTELAQERVVQIRQPELLRQLVKQIFRAPDETTARWLLTTFAA